MGCCGRSRFLGFFSHILNGLGPGLGTTKATKADATFKIEDQSVKSDDLTVAAGVFTLNARGKVGFDSKLDFQVQGQLLKSWPGVNWLSYLLAHAFTYKIGGTLGDYNYRPVNMPKEFLPHGDSKEKAPAGTPETDK